MNEINYTALFHVLLFVLFLAVLASYSKKEEK